MSAPGEQPPDDRPEEPSGAVPAEWEREVRALVEDFLERRQAGEALDGCDVILAHPHLAQHLEPRLEAAERLLELAGISDAVPGAKAAAPEVVPESCLPTVIGRYEIRQLIGQGASAVVYRAYDPKLHREVALKVIRLDQPGGPAFTERFERKARIAAGLRHPNIVPFHETGEADGRRYIDMELIAGESLHAQLRALEGRPLGARRAAELAQKIAAALAYAHGMGIVHRDVKPSNILIDGRGEPQLTDFDLACRTGVEQSLTVQGQILGTPAYMAPEQAEGRAHRVDGRTDVYGLGVVLYRMLTGRLPFEETHSIQKLLALIVGTEPPRPRSLNPQVPRDLETICLKALEKRPDDRFASAREFADELRRALDDEPLRIRRPTVWERVRRWSRQNWAVPRILILSAVVLGAVSVTLGGIAWDQHERRYREQVQAEAQLHEVQVRESLEAEKRAEMEAWALLTRARQRLAVPTAGRRREAQASLNQLAELWGQFGQGEAAARLEVEARSVWAETLSVPEVEVLASEKMPGVFYAYWKVALHPDGETAVIGTHRRPLRWVPGKRLERSQDLDPAKPRPAVTYSPDGQYLVFVPPEGGLRVWDGTVSRVMADLDPGGKAPYLAIGFDPGVKKLWACRADGEVRSWSLPDCAPAVRAKLNRPGTPPLTAAAFNTDATLLAVGRKDGQVFLYQADGKRLRQWPAADREVQALAWSPDSRLVAVGTASGGVQLWHRDGTPSFPLPPLSDGVSRIQFSPDGRWVLAGHGANGTRVYDVQSGEQVSVAGGTICGFARDGRHFATGSSSAVSLCQLLPPAVFELSGHRARIARLVWSRDNRHLASLDHAFEVRVWDVTRHGPVVAFREDPGTYAVANAAVALSDDATQVAYAAGGNGTSLLIREVSTGRELAKWPLPAGFERLACLGGRRFLLVREEDTEKPHVRRTVAYRFAVGEPPGPRTVLRPAVDGERSFFEHDLTPDGRYYIWSGPREPLQSHRVELYDVAAGRLLLAPLPRPLRPEAQSFEVRLSPDGRCFLISGENGGCQLYDRDRNAAAENLPAMPDAMSPDTGWLVFALDPGRQRLNPGISLKRRADGRTWIELSNRNLGDPSAVAFSGDGRYLAWGSVSGVITVADLDILQKEVGEFEKRLASN
ncbi:MAG TPA: serine/threonine-protein kinase [Gemmataceae bacterium]|nr:serine/threonine-protein kinase [Gemmataceae bacterium]